MRLVFVLFLMAFRLPAEISIEGYLDGRFATADLVCRGTVESAPAPVDEGALDPRGKLRPLDYYADVSVESCYKGQNPPPQLRVWFLQHSQGQGPVAASGQNVLMFLNLRDDRYVPVTRFDSFVRFWSVPGASAPRTDGLAQLESDILLPVGGNDKERSRDAVSLLLSFSQLSKGTSDRLLKASEGAAGDTRLRVDALVARFLSTVGQERRDALRQLNGALAGGLSNEILWDIIPVEQAIPNPTSEEDLDILEEIAATSIVSVLRNSAMLGIRKLRSPKSVPFLVEQLNAADDNVAYQALITLAEMNGKGGEYGPSLPVYHLDPARYRQLWLGWWQSEGQAKFR